MLVDTHAHLDAEEFAADRDAVIARARDAGVGVMICPGITAASSQAAVDLAGVHAGVLAAVGIQPNYAVQAAADDWNRIKAMALMPRVVAIGETGLDRYWDFTPWELQQDFFDRHLRLAQARDLPVIIHCRDCQADVLTMLREATGRGPVRGVMHAASGDGAFMRQCVELGLYVSLAGPVTYSNKKFQVLREATREIPADRLLIETDSPYLVPQALRGRERRNEPAWLVHTVEVLAELRGQDIASLAAQTTANARVLFRLPGEV